MDASSACACPLGSHADNGVGIYSGGDFIGIYESICPLNCVGLSHACFVPELDVCVCISFLPDDTFSNKDKKDSYNWRHLEVFGGYPVLHSSKIYRNQSDVAKKRTIIGDKKTDDLVAPAAIMMNKILQHRIIDDFDMKEHHKTVLDPSYCNITKAKRNKLSMKRMNRELHGLMKGIKCLVYKCTGKYRIRIGLERIHHMN